MDDRRGHKSVLGKEWKIQGELTVHNDAVIEGQIDGVLRSSGQLELAAGARVSGTVVGDTIRIAGEADADVVGREEVELLPGSKVRGRVYAHRFGVHEGASYRGQIVVDPEAMALAKQEVLSSQEPSTKPATTPQRESASELSSQELAMLTGENSAGNGSRPMRIRPVGNGR